MVKWYDESNVGEIVFSEFLSYDGTKIVAETVKFSKPDWFIRTVGNSLRIITHYPSYREKSHQLIFSAIPLTDRISGSDAVLDFRHDGDANLKMVQTSTRISVAVGLILFFAILVIFSVTFQYTSVRSKSYVKGKSFLIKV